MENRIVTNELLNQFAQYLFEEERSEGTVEKYKRDMKAFQLWLNGNEVTQEKIQNWKEVLLEKGLKPTTINAKLAALKVFCRWANWMEIKIKVLKLQRPIFREHQKELTRDEYRHLCATAQTQGKERLALVMEVICGTGIRVSELRYITVKAIKEGKAEIRLKGKVRTILLPGKLCHKLMKFAKRKNIVEGEIFITRTGRSLSRKQIWAEMKALCEVAGVEPSKVFPHNLRHLFAVCFYKACRDVVKLADILGHSNVDTTRIYLISSGLEHARILEQLELIF
ncbi:MAG: tyrosine-type recombinase/integrase [Firmicutes bacterium]|nr:tyrosine-type recombinase/integrase [Bacillota bacterium]